MAFVQLFLDIVVGIISEIGYPGIFVLMFLETTIFPIPSELVLPFAGYLSALGELDFILVVLVATIGSVSGGLLFYFIGKHFGKKAILKYGKYIFLDNKSLEISEKWFKKYGGRTIFFCRFIPAIRHVISIPAGIARMPLKKFVLATFLGSLGWNAFLTYTGILLQENWQIILEYSQIVDIIVIIGIIIAVIVYFYLHLRK